MPEPADDKRAQEPASATEEPLKLDAFGEQVRGVSPSDASIKFAIAPGHASAKDIAAFLQALSNLHVAAGGGGLHFTRTGTLGSAILLEARPKEMMTAELDSEALSAVMALGSYADADQFVRHSFAVTLALLQIHDVGLFMQRPGEVEPFDLLEIDTELRQILPEPHQHESASREYTVVTFSKTDDFERLMRVGEFTSIGQCLDLTLNVLARILIARDEGFELVRKERDECVSIELPKPEDI